jgi:hypothetical protein
MIKRQTSVSYNIDTVWKKTRPARVEPARFHSDETLGEIYHAGEWKGVVGSSGCGDGVWRTQDGAFLSPATIVCALKTSCPPGILPDSV